MDTDKTTTVIGGVAGLSILTAGITAIQAGHLLPGILGVVGGLCIMALGYLTNKSA